VDTFLARGKIHGTGNAPERVWAQFHKRSQQAVRALGCFFVLAKVGFEEGGDAKGGAKKCPVDTFLARGKIHGTGNAPERVWAQFHKRSQQAVRALGCFFVLAWVGKRKYISIVHVF